MRKVIALTLAAGLILSASACNNANGPALATTAGTISAAVLPPDAEAQLRQGCAAADPLLAVATGPAAPKTVSDIAVYPTAYCKALMDAPNGTVPATTDASTTQWWSTALAATETAARIAMFVLPML